MLKQARDIPEMRAWGEAFDRDPLTYNVQNGTLRFFQDGGGSWIMKFQSGHEPTDMLRQIRNLVKLDTGEQSQDVARDRIRSHDQRGVECNHTSRRDRPLRTHQGSAGGEMSLSSPHRRLDPHLLVSGFQGLIVRCRSKR